MVMITMFDDKFPPYVYCFGGSRCHNSEKKVETYQPSVLFLTQGTF